MKKLPLTKTLATVAAAVTLLISTAAHAGTSWMHGGNWGGSGQPGNICYPDGITNTLTIVQATDIANALADDYKAVGLNTVRCPFDPKTVFDQRAWPITTNCINTLIGRGLKIDLLCLYCDQDKTDTQNYLRITNYFLWKKAWTNVDKLYGANTGINTNVYFEPINEPHGYTAHDLSNLVYEPFLELTHKTPSQIILDPVAPGADSINWMSRFSSCLIACHVYAAVGNTYKGAFNMISNKVGTYPSRVILNEVGADTRTGADYINYNSSNTNVVFLDAVNDETTHWFMGYGWCPTHIVGSHWDRMFNGYPGGPNSYILNRSLIDAMQLHWSHFTTLYTPGCDFNNFGQTDYCYYRPDLDNFGIQSGGGGHWGSPGDIAVPSDYNGVGKVQMATWDPSTHYWNIYPYTNVIQYGQNNDVPVPGDYRGIGSAQVAVWRPSSGTWIVNGKSDIVWGTNGDIPVPGYYNGDGHLDYATYRPSNGKFYVFQGAGPTFGQSGDVPVPGDYLGNGTTQFAVYRPSTSTWIIYGVTNIQFGTVGDIPVPGDYTGAGFTQMATWNPTTFMWNVDGLSPVKWGSTNFIPLPLPFPVRSACYGYTE